MPTTDYKSALHKRLTKPDYAAKYLNAALHEDEATFLLAVRDIVEAMGGVAALAKTTGLNRVSLYRLLSGQGNPTLSSLNAIMRALGFILQCRPATSRQAA